MEELPVSRKTQDVSNGLVRLYDESFNWKFPTDPGPWTTLRQEEFD
jgi:hypothetical protein